MDRLVAEEIDIDELPSEAAPTRAPVGRIGELWERFQALKPNRVLKVECRDRIHVGTTDRALRKKARNAGIPLRSQRVDATFFCWKG